MEEEEEPKDLARKQEEPEHEGTVGKDQETKVAADRDGSRGWGERGGIGGMHPPITGQDIPIFPSCFHFL